MKNLSVNSDQQQVLTAAISIELIKHKIVLVERLMITDQ